MRAIIVIIITGVNPAAGDAGDTSPIFRLVAISPQYYYVLLLLSDIADQFFVALVCYSFSIKNNFKFSTSEFAKICHFEITKQTIAPPQASPPVGRGIPSPHAPPSSALRRSPNFELALTPVIVMFLIIMRTVGLCSRPIIAVFRALSINFFGKDGLALAPPPEKKMARTPILCWSQFVLVPWTCRI